MFGLHNNGASVGEAIKNQKGKYMNYSLGCMKSSTERILTSVSSSILAPSACSSASKMSREVFPDLWSEKNKTEGNTNVFILLDLNGVKANPVLLVVRLNICDINTDPDEMWIECHQCNILYIKIVLAANAGEKLIITLSINTFQT